jgi:DNA adenine methylase
MRKVKVYEKHDPQVTVNDPNLFGMYDNPSHNVEVNYTVRSPLRYPGGKTRAVEIISRSFPSRIKELVAPFFGGGSIELLFAARGVRVHGYDVFRPLVEFWQCLLLERDQLANEVEKYYPLSRERFYQLQEQQTKFPAKLERAAVYYVLNRCSFSGATLSGGMSPGHPRFTLSSIQRLREFNNPNIWVEKADFEESLARHQHMFAYLDPPYLIDSGLYGKKGDAHKDFDHVRLAKILKARRNWVLSYNDCEDIRELYRGFKIMTPNWKYGMSNDKTSKEVLIFSDDLESQTRYVPTNAYAD